MRLKVTQLTADRIICGGWEFDRQSGAEIDEDLGWGPSGVTGSFLEPETGTDPEEDFRSRALQRLAALLDGGKMERNRGESIPWTARRRIGTWCIWDRARWAGRVWSSRKPARFRRKAGSRPAMPASGRTNMSNRWRASIASSRSMGRRRGFRSRTQVARPRPRDRGKAARTWRTTRAAGRSSRRARWLLVVN